MDDNPVILFDGICNLCNNAVQFVIKHDKKKIFRFASLQSESGKALLHKYGLPVNDPNSFVLVQNNKAYTKSTAALLVTQKLSGAVKLLYGFIIVPPFLRNGIYKMVAANRYKWFGKKDSCMVPSAGLSARFLK